jgi:hypothetical protein
MDVYKHPTDGKLSRKLAATNLEMKEFSHKCWGPVAPYMQINGTQLINGGYIFPEIEVVNLATVNFKDSPGNHRLLIFEISTSQYKVCRPVSRCLITSQQSSVNRCNEIIREQFKLHLINKRLNTVEGMMQYCGYPSPEWQRAMILKLYKQMTKIQKHAEKKCHKILCNFSPTVHMWYDRIHPYLQLICLKEGKSQNVRNIMQFAKCKHIKKPQELTLDELKDELQLTRIRKLELQKQAIGLCKEHL